MQGLLTQLIYFSIFIFITAFFTTEDKPKIIKTIIYSNFAVIIYGLLQILKLDPLQNLWLSEEFLGRTFGTLGNPNWLAAFIILTLPILLYEYAKAYARQNFRTKIFYFLFSILNLIVLISTSSKAGLLALIIISIIWLIKKSNRKISIFSTAPYRHATTYLYGAIILFLILFITYTFHSRYSNSFELGRSTKARQIIWTQTIKMIKARPLGYGLETFQFIYPQFNDPKLWEYEKITARIDSAHNQILDLWIKTGPFGMIIFYAFLILLIIKNLKSEKNSLNFYFALSLIGYAITNLFGFETITTGIFFWITIGLLSNEKNDTLFSYGRMAIRPDIRPDIRPKFFPAFLSLILLTSTFLQLNHLQANINYSKGNTFLKEKNYTQALTEFQKSIQIYPYDRIYLLQTAELLLASEQNKKFGTEIKNYLIQAKKLSHSKDAEIPILEAWFSAINGDQKLFTEKLNQAKTLNPYSITTYKIAYQIYKKLKQNENAKKELENLKKLLPSYWDKKETDAGRIFQKENKWIIELLS